MKKVTLVFLILFVILVGGIFILSFLYPSNIKTISNNKLSVSEVVNHNTANDCYLIIKNKIYNVSALPASHPGGRKNIIDNCGHEVTGLFADIHSNDVWDLLSEYYIGDIILK